MKALKSAAVVISFILLPTAQAQFAGPAFWQTSLATMTKGAIFGMGSLRGAGGEPDFRLYNTNSMSSTTSGWTKYADYSPLTGGNGHCSTFTPDGKKFASGIHISPYIHVINTSDSSKIAAPATLPTAVVNGCAFSPDGLYLAVAFKASPYLIIYNTNTWAKLPNPSSLPSGNGRSIAWSPDGATLAIGLMASPYLELYSTSTWTKITGPASAPPGDVNGLSWSNDGTWLAVGHINNPYITVYQTSTWTKLLQPATTPTTSVFSVSFTPDGSKLAVGIFGGGVFMIYNTTGWTAAVGPSVISRPALPAGTTRNRALSFSPDGSILAVGLNVTPWVRFYKVSDWSVLSNLTSGANEEAISMSWGPW